MGAVTNFVTRRLFESRLANVVDIDDVDDEIEDHDTKNGAHLIYRGTGLPFGTQADWQQPTVPLLRGPNGAVWIRDIDTSSIPTAPVVVDGAINERLQIAANHMSKAYVTTDGAVTDGGTVSPWDTATALLVMVLRRDKETFTKILTWANTNLRRGKTGGGAPGTFPDAWGGSATSNGVVSDWTIDAGAEVRAAKALWRAWNLWGENAHKAAAQAKTAAVKSLTIADEGRVYLGHDDLQKTTTFGHHQYNSSYYSKHSLRDYDFVAFQLMYIATGDDTFTKLIAGGKDLWNKSTATTGNLATTVGLPPRRLYYETAGHTVGAINNGQMGWNETQNTNYDAESAVAVVHLYDFYKTYADSWAEGKLKGALATFYNAQWNAGTVYTEYTHTGSVVGSGQKVSTYLIAQMVFTANGNTSSVAAITSGKIPDDGLDGNGRYFPDQIKGVGPQTTLSADNATWLGNSQLSNLARDIAVLGANPSPGSGSTTVTTPPVVTVPVDPTPVKGTYKIIYDPNSQAMGWATSMDSSNPARKAAATWFALVPQALWVGGWDEQWNGAQTYLNWCKQNQAVAFMLSYFLPGLDLGQYSAGGAASAAQYRNYVATGVAKITANAPYMVALVGEPDGIPHAIQLSTEERATRMALTRYGIDQFSQVSNLWYYPDIGHPGWLSPQDAAKLLLEAGADKVRRFALNTSNYWSFEKCVAYANQIRAILGAEWHYTIDTGRNGNPNDPPTWLNPPRRRLGMLPQWGGFDTAIPGLDGVMWWKRPGESDGNGGDGAPTAGSFWTTSLYNTSILSQNGGYNVDTGSIQTSSGMLQRPPTPGVPIAAPT